VSYSIFSKLFVKINTIEILIFFGNFAYLNHICNSISHQFCIFLKVLLELVSESEESLLRHLKSNIQKLKNVTIASGFEPLTISKW